MSFVKKTWKSRVGTGLAKFKLNGLPNDPVVELENVPDSVTQQGDSMDATAMNDLESRIESGFTGLTPVESVTLTSTSGTLTTAQYAILTSNRDSYILYSSGIYRLTYDNGTYMYYEYTAYSSSTSLNQYRFRVTKSSRAYTYYSSTISRPPTFYQHSITIVNGSYSYVFLLTTTASGTLSSISGVESALYGAGFTSSSRTLMATGIGSEGATTPVVGIYTNGSYPVYIVSSGRSSTITSGTVYDRVTTIG